MVVQNTDAADVVGCTLELGGCADNVVEIQVGDSRLGTGVQGPLHGVLEVVGGDVLAVVKLDVVPEVEGVGTLVVTDVPARGYVGDDVEVLVYGDEAAEDLYYYEGGAGIGSEGGVEGGRIGEEPGEFAPSAC